VAALVATATVGCSTMGLGGSSEFACPMTGGVTCESVDTVYRMSRNGTLPKAVPPAPSQAPTSGEAAEPVPAVTQARTTAVDPPLAAAPARVANPAAVSTAPARAQAAGFMPLRSQPWVLRGWIAAFEDSDGDLVGESYVYMPIDGGRWMVEHARPRRGDAGPTARPAEAAALAPSAGVLATAAQGPARTAAAARPDASATPGSTGAAKGAAAGADGAGSDLAAFAAAIQGAARDKPASGEPQ